MLKLNCKNKTTFDENTKIWSGPKFLPYYERNCSLGKILFEEMRRRASKICQISDTENTYITNEEALLQGIRVARSFERLGIKQSDIIGITGRNTTYLQSVALGCFFHGTAFHSLSPNYTKQIMKKLFEITKPKIIFCDGQDLEKIQFAVADITPKIYTLKNHVEGVPTVFDLLQPTGNEHEYDPAELEKGPEQTLAIICSSGSSGTPKPIKIPHCKRPLVLMEYLTEDDIQFATSTLDWHTGVFTLITSIIHGAARVITDLPLTADYMLKLIEKYKVTSMIVPSPVMATLSKCKEATVEKLKSMRYFLYCGAKVPLSVQETFQSLLKNGIIIEGYGITEFNGCICRNLNFRKKPESAGTLLPGVKVCVIDKNGKRLGANELGEILCQHGEYWGGYFNNVEATNKLLDQEGWFHSDDLGYFDDDGYLYVVERIKEILRYDRSIYYPHEVEEIISKIPEVKEVCVFGIEHEIHFYVAAAAVVLVEGSFLKAEDVIEFVKNYEEASCRHLHGGCKIFKEIPKTANYKNDRKAAKALYLENK